MKDYLSFRFLNQIMSPAANIEIPIVFILSMIDCFPRHARLRDLGGNLADLKKSRAKVTFPLIFFLSHRKSGFIGA